MFPESNCWKTRAGKNKGEYMAVPLLDLKRQYETIKNRIDKAVLNVFNHSKFILGPEVAELEARVASFCGVRFGVGVASGTDALLLSLRAAGIGPGDEVITSDYSFFSSTSVISRIGAIPVFIDIEKETFNIDPRHIKRAISPKTKAIIPVHLFGQTADMDPILDLAKEYNLIIIEDAAQAIGAGYKGRKAGSMGAFGCFSFFPSKNLGAAGDGGMIVTDDEELASRLKVLRVHGWKKKYHPEVIGYNSRLATLQAAVLLVKLDYLEQWSKERIAHARVYDKAFAGSAIQIPIVKNYAYHIYNQYTIVVDNREELRAVLKERNIGHDVYYPVPFHRLECYKGKDYARDDFPISDWAAAHCLSIPVFPELTDSEQREVIDVVKSVSG
jgi:dTDP-4-amino-4,6-dideoxygalactose transaminase